jgi:hypothetical protein
MTGTLIMHSSALPMLFSKGDNSSSMILFFPL